MEKVKAKSRKAIGRGGGAEHFLRKKSVGTESWAWYVLVIPTSGGRRIAVVNQPGLHSELEASPSYNSEG